VPRKSGSYTTRRSCSRILGPAVSLHNTQIVEQNIGASSGMMQISVAFMHSCMRAGTLRVANSDAHKMLLKICIWKTATTALMVQADVVTSFDMASQNVHQSRTWLAIREKVIALLRSGAGAPAGAE